MNRIAAIQPAVRLAVGFLLAVAGSGPTTAALLANAQLDHDSLAGWLLAYWEGSWRGYW